MTERLYNFSAGPAVLPEVVLRKIRDDLLSLPGVGMSVMEISHRSDEYRAIQNAAAENLRTLLKIPDSYRILFLQGGSRLQFSMIPMNLLRGTGRIANYILTGTWGQKAYQEAVKEGEVHACADCSQSGYSRLPAAGEIQLHDPVAYVHLTSNETIEGVQFKSEPAIGDATLVCDASSDFLCRPLPIERYGMIYACAQKNAGVAGVTVVIMHDDLVSRGQDDLPGYLNYRSHAENDSLFNTPPTFAVYVMKLVTDWLLGEVGGLEDIHQRNQAKSAMLYEAIDQSNGFYVGHAEPAARSIMNVTFRLNNDEQQAAFLEAARSRDLVNLLGHRSVRGIRASIYNAMPEQGVTALRDLMQDFRREHS